MTKKLQKMPYAQACVRINDDGSAVLISYTTEVAKLSADGWVTVNGLYSRTTIRHIAAFASEYCKSNYSTLKRCYQENLAYNIFDYLFMSLSTGEIV